MAVNPKNKAATTESKQLTYKLESPDGREYITSDAAEATNLNRAQGYRLVSPKTLEEDVEGLDAPSAGDKPADAWAQPTIERTGADARSS